MSDEWIGTAPLIELGSVEVIFKIRPSEDGSGRVFGFTGDIRVCVDGEHPSANGEKIVVVGKIEGVVAPELGTAHEMLALAERVSNDVYGLANLPWDLAHKDPFLPGLTEGFLSAWIGVQLILVEAAWRGQNIGYAAMRELVRLAASNTHTLITAKPRSAAAEACGPEKRRPPQAEIERLQRYWHTFGLRLIEGTEVYGHGLGMRWPGGSWMRRHSNK